MEDRNLLVVAAGSGKTSTVVGKIGYVLRSKQFTANDLLVLAFNKDAAKELDERVNERLRELLPPERIKVKTFHALGLEIIGAAEGKKPTVSNLAGGGGAADSVLIDQLIGCRSGIELILLEFLSRRWGVDNKVLWGRG